MNKARLALSERLLSRLCKSEFIEEIVGDLHEYEGELQSQPPWKRRIFFWFHVVNFLQPWALKKLGGTQKLNQYGMFKNYFKTSARSLRKNALFSAINMVGLAISMMVGILMITLISEVKSYDAFHIHKDRLYRVTSSRDFNGEELHYSSASMFVGNGLKAQVPGIEKSVTLYNRMQADFTTETEAIPVKGYYSSAEFFQVFSFKLLSGNPKTAFQKPSSIVLTESTAKRLFGDKEAVGELIEVGGNSEFSQGIVTGIMEDPPLHSHLRFEVLVSINTLEKRSKEREFDYKLFPGNIYSAHVYFLLNPNTDPEKVVKGINQIVAEYNVDARVPVSHGLQQADVFFTDDVYLNQTGPRFSGERLKVMVILTLVVLLSASFNYTNLSLAKALRRSKEVGVRKVAGATRFQVFMQFMVESVIITFIALLVAIGLFYYLRPVFLSVPIPGSLDQNIFSLALDPVLLFYCAGFGLVMALLSGAIPASFLSRLKAKILIKDTSKIKPISGVSLRKLLIVLQFAISIGLITSAVLVRSQYHYVLNYDLGYKTGGIVSIYPKGDYMELLETELAKIPGVEATSKSSMVLGVGSASMAVAQTDDKEKQTRLMINEIDHRYLDMHQVSLLAGSGFTRPLATGETPRFIVVDQDFIKALELGSPEEAIGQYVWQGKNRLQVIGVIDDLVVTGLDAKLEDAFAFVQPADAADFQVLNVKLSGQNLQSVFMEVLTAYEKIDPIHPLDASFYEQAIANLYKSQKTTFSVMSFLALLAISISTLGLLGMAVFTTESRLKEISIRKVLGAGVGGLMILLAKSFVLLILIGGALAVPLSIYVVDAYVLDQFWQRAPIEPFQSVSGLLMVLAIAAATITWQIWQAATKNPADLLRMD